MFLDLDLDLEFRVTKLCPITKIKGNFTYRHNFKKYFKKALFPTKYIKVP